jgi:hypothetical protein
MKKKTSALSGKKSSPKEAKVKAKRTPAQRKARRKKIFAAVENVAAVVAKVILHDKSEAMKVVTQVDEVLKDEIEKM